ncbi:MAG: ribosome maturation factor RimM [Lachnospiraceae bacterium]|nr:ribosome maturation factor RimM [Lachnospiraceae bacterium]
MEDRFQVGIITGTHGIAGEVKVFPTTDDSSRFRKLKQVILDTGSEELELEVARVRFSKQMVILKFREFQNINEVECFRGKSLYVTRENAVKLEKDEYFIADLIGMKVVSTDGEDLGILKDVMQTGANDVYIAADPGGTELLLPAIHDCVRKIDMDQGVITVFLMPGLRD